MAENIVVNKWAEDLNKHFSKEDIQLASRFMKSYSTSPVVREVQIKTPVRYHLTPLRMAIIKKSRDSKLVKIWRKGNPRALLVRM